MGILELLGVLVLGIGGYYLVQNTPMFIGFVLGIFLVPFLCTLLIFGIYDIVKGWLK